jgi:uncharacterized protein (TIGR03435 family)
LSIERETRTEEVYLLTARQIPSAQLRPSREKDGIMSGGSEKSIIGTNQTMKDIASIFQSLLNTPVIDESGVEGKFSYSALSNLSPPESVFDFARQLGLELTPAVRPVELLVVRAAGQ